MSIMSCGPNCVCHPSPTVALRPRVRAKRLPFAAALTTKNPTLRDIQLKPPAEGTIEVETLSGGESHPEEIPTLSEGSCAACCSGVSFDLDSISSLPDIPEAELQQSKARLSANDAHRSLQIDLTDFRPAARLTSVPILPKDIITIEGQQAPLSPPETPRSSSENARKPAVPTNIVGDDDAGQQRLASKHPPRFVQPHPPYEVFSASITHAERMTRDGAAKRVYHLSIDVSEYPLPVGESWLVGGSFGVCPANETSVVEELIDVLGIDGARDGILLKTASGRWPTVWGDDQARTLPTTKFDLLRWCSDLSSSPIKKSVLRVLAEYAEDAYERQILLYLVSRQGQTSFCNLRSGNPITLTHLLQAFPSSRPPLSHLLSVLPQLMPRWYSLSSDPSSNHGTLEFAFTVAEVPHYRGHLRGGVGSGFLESLAESVIAGEKDARLPMFRGLHANPFTKDFADSGPMILIGAGVGIAPFRGFVQRRVSSAKCAGKVYVIQGCRDSQFDGIYGNDLQSATHCIVESQAGRKEYVQDEVVRQGELIWRVMMQERGRIYVCGAAKGFLQGIEKALRKVASKHGNLSDEESKALWQRWQDPLDLRVVLEVW